MAFLIITVNFYLFVATGVWLHDLSADHDGLIFVLVKRSLIVLIVNRRHLFHKRLNRLAERLSCLLRRVEVFLWCSVHRPSLHIIHVLILEVWRGVFRERFWCDLVTT